MQNLINKSQARRLLKEKVNSLSLDVREQKDQAIYQQLKNIILSQFSHSVIGVYNALADEPQLNYLWSELLLKKVSVAMPTYNDQKMAFSMWHKEEFEGPWHNPIQNEPAKPTVVIIPGLGFSQKGFRLGRGQGHYDKWLATHQAYTIGVGYDEQLSIKWNNEEHDQILNMILTDKHCFEVGIKQEVNYG